MIFWLDAHLSPAIAVWIEQQFGIVTQHVVELGLRDADDLAIFEAARAANAVLLTKDIDFEDLVLRLGSPPQIVRLSCGNTSNAELKRIFATGLSETIKLLEAGEPLVEIQGAH
jgi:predicted nuclease of predicted toxin-antitoxin system